MARPKRLKKKEQALLGDQEVYRLIKQHPEVKACKNLNISQIRAVFKAYKDIAYTATKMGNRINLPFLGQFFSSEENGWQGGYISYREDFNDKNSKVIRKYFDPKPDYSLIRFEFKKSIRDKFKEETEIPLKEENLEALRKVAEMEEKERLEHLNE